MRKTGFILTSILVIGIVLLSTHFIYAQQRDNRRQQQDRPQFDPQQMMQRMMERIMERLKLSEEESAVIKPQIESIMNLRTKQASEMRDLMDALQKAIDAKDEKQIGTALTAIKTKRLEQKTASEKAEKELIELLTVEQEANLTLLGVVNSDGMGMGFRFGQPGGNPPGQPGGNRPQRQGNQRGDN
jgi:hypothetical protein